MMIFLHCVLDLQQFITFKSACNYYSVEMYRPKNSYFGHFIHISVNNLKRCNFCRADLEERVLK